MPSAANSPPSCKCGGRYRSGLACRGGSLLAGDGASDAEVGGRGEDDGEERVWALRELWSKSSVGLSLLPKGASFLFFCEEAVAK